MWGDLSSGRRLTLAEARRRLDLGTEYCRVEYRPAFDPPARGVITSVRDRFVFVRWDGYTEPQATDPANLVAVAAA